LRGKYLTALRLIRNNVRELKALKEDFTLKDVKDFIRMDYSVSRLPISPKVVKAINSAIDTVNDYPNGECLQLREALAKYNKVDSAEIIVGNGSDEIIDMISRTFLEQDDEVIILTPTYSFYEYTAKVAGAKVKSIHSLTDKTYKIDPEQVCKNVSSKTKIIWICNPNNPTGNAIPQESIEKILEGTDCIVVVDECFFEFLEETSISFLEKFDRLIIVRSLSKTFGLAGLRIGYAIANTEIINNIWKVKPLFNVNSIAQVAAIAALEDLDYYKAVWEKIADEREYLAKRLSELEEIEVFPSVTNFILINVYRCKKPPAEIFDELFQRKILVLPGWSIDFSGLGPHFFRVLVGSRQENDRLVEELENIIKNR
jgi:histidinol-phosphate aminotransferase